MFQNRSIFILVCLISFSNLFADRYKRPMNIHEVKRIGLEIWTEYEPKWKTELMTGGIKPVFVAHTPANVYPQAGMMWVSHAEVLIKKNEFYEVAKSTLISASKQYGVAINDSEVTPTVYGKLKGYETNFVGKLNKQDVDVKIFTGRYQDKGPITMHVYTNKGKMNHIRENIRRSWSNVTYLDN